MVMSLSNEVLNDPPFRSPHNPVPTPAIASTRWQGLMNQANARNDQPRGAALLEVANKPAWPSLDESQQKKAFDNVQPTMDTFQSNMQRGDGDSVPEVRGAASDDELSDGGGSDAAYTSYTGTDSDVKEDADVMSREAIDAEIAAAESAAAAAASEAAEAVDILQDARAALEAHPGDDDATAAVAAAQAVAVAALRAEYAANHALDVAKAKEDVADQKVAAVIAAQIAAVAAAATLEQQAKQHVYPQQRSLRNCVYCYRVFDPAKSRGCGSMADLRGRSYGALEIADSDRFCDFIAEHPGWERARFWTCCGTEVGTTFGCHVCVVPHTTLQNDPVRMRLLAPRTVPDPPQAQEKPAEEGKCHYCHMMFNINMPRRVGGITDLDRSRECMSILNTSEFCDFLVEHPGPVRQGRSYRYYACCSAEVGTTFGCRCIVVQHSVQVDDDRPKVLREIR